LSTSSDEQLCDPDEYFGSKNAMLWKLVKQSLKDDPQLIQDMVYVGLQMMTPGGSQALMNIKTMVLVPSSDRAMVMNPIELIRAIGVQEKLSPGLIFTGDEQIRMGKNHVISLDTDLESVHSMFKSKETLIEYFTRRTESVIGSPHSLLNHHGKYKSNICWDVTKPRFFKRETLCEPNRFIHSVASAFTSDMPDAFYGPRPLLTRHENHVNSLIDVIKDVVESTQTHTMTVVENFYTKYVTNQLVKSFEEKSVFHCNTSGIAVQDFGMIEYVMPEDTRRNTLNYIVPIGTVGIRVVDTALTRSERTMKSQIQNFFRLLKKATVVVHPLELDPVAILKNHSYHDLFERKLFFKPYLLHRPSVWVTNVNLGQGFIPLNRHNYGNMLKSMLAYTKFRRLSIRAGCLPVLGSRIADRCFVEDGALNAVTSLIEWVGRFNSYVYHPRAGKITYTPNVLQTITSREETFRKFVSIGGDPIVTSTKRKRNSKWRVDYYELRKQCPSFDYHCDIFLMDKLIIKEEREGRVSYYITYKGKKYYEDGIVPFMKGDLNMFSEEYILEKKQQEWDSSKSEVHVSEDCTCIHCVLLDKAIWNLEFSISDFSIDDLWFLPLHVKKKYMSLSDKDFVSILDRCSMSRDFLLVKEGLELQFEDSFYGKIDVLASMSHSEIQRNLLPLSIPMLTAMIYQQLIWYDLDGYHVES
jgi:hypothetical protein